MWNFNSGTSVGPDTKNNKVFGIRNPRNLCFDRFSIGFFLNLDDFTPFKYETFIWGVEKLKENWRYNTMFEFSDPEKPVSR